MLLSDFSVPPTTYVSKPYSPQDPLPLERCIVCCEPEWDDYFEIQEFVNKECFVFKVRIYYSDAFNLINLTPPLVRATIRSRRGCGSRPSSSTRRAWAAGGSGGKASATS